MDPHEANRAFWDASAAWWQEREDERGLWRKAAADPSCVLSPAELPFLTDVAGRDACVLGSGDQEVAFALVGLGARVTSVDISEQRLQIAAARAEELGLDLTFVRADVAELTDLGDASFDLVYAGGHLTVWIADLGRFMAEATRVLRPGGRLVINEYHPFRRMWLEAEGLEPHYGYFERGPHEYHTDDGLATYEHHWTVADHVQAVVDAGCRIVKVEEHGEHIADEFFMQVQLDKLPAHLLVVGEKPRPGA